MCELLGMSTNIATDFCFNLTGLFQRGGITGPHKDGWGIAYYDGDAARIIKDPLAGGNSELAKFIENYPIHSKMVISHIRRANRGRVCLENTHPFSRELWGRQWTFAHNGQLFFIKKRKLLWSQPVGTTDSEYAFCWMMDHIRERFPKPPKSMKTLMQFIHGLCDELSTDGVFNMLLSDAHYLYAYCSTRLSILTRQAPFGHVHLMDKDMSVDFDKVLDKKALVTIVATMPLTKEATWKKLEKGQFIAMKDGVVYNEMLKPAYF